MDLEGPCWKSDAPFDRVLTAYEWLESGAMMALAINADPSTSMTQLSSQFQAREGMAVIEGDLRDSFELCCEEVCLMKMSLGKLLLLIGYYQ